jgi:hypothetical protein
MSKPDRSKIQNHGDYAMNKSLSQTPMMMLNYKHKKTKYFRQELADKESSALADKNHQHYHADRK